MVQVVQGPWGLSGWWPEQGGPCGSWPPRAGLRVSRRLTAAPCRVLPAWALGRCVCWMLRAGWAGSSGWAGPCAPSPQAARLVGLTHFQWAGLPQRTAWGVRVGETWKPNLAFSWPGKKLTVPASSHGGKSWRAGGRAAGRLLAPARAGERGSCSRRFTAPPGRGKIRAVFPISPSSGTPDSHPARGGSVFQVGVSMPSGTHSLAWWAGSARGQSSQRSEGVGASSGPQPAGLNVLSSG